jgi:hypothetical protein
MSEDIMSDDLGFKIPTISQDERERMIDEEVKSIIVTPANESKEAKELLDFIEANKESEFLKLLKYMDLEITKVVLGLNNQEDLKPEIVKMVDDNFWELI